MRLLPLLLGVNHLLRAGAFWADGNGDFRRRFRCSCQVLQKNLQKNQRYLRAAGTRALHL